VRKGSVIEAIDADSIYDVPLLMQKEGLDQIVLNALKLPSTEVPDLRAWHAFLDKLKNPKHQVRIGLVGKYNELQDAYKSIHEALVHAGTVHQCDVEVTAIHSEFLELTENRERVLKNLDGVLVAPGFGERGITGKILAIEYVRENKIPFFGICLGMQCAVVEFAQNVLALDGAASTEVHPETSHPVIDMMPDQKKITMKGGTMRLGAYDCRVKPGTLAYESYGEELISERHRHRYEFNNEYLNDFASKGMVPTGMNPDSNLVEIVELKDHPWFVGVQFHPELRSRVEQPHPLFVSFIKACLDYATTARDPNAAYVKAKA
jgi:CTP synthase